VTEAISLYDIMVISADSTAYKPVYLWITANGITTKNNVLGDVADKLPVRSNNFF